MLVGLNDNFMVENALESSDIILLHGIKIAK